jgi:lipopolysaccharide/colanic/teichoic acid biosynthesis glycosyltransferase
MWKVRTMRDRPGRGGTITLRGDDRITPLGRRLRALRLDELPQLWNVVRGDMALLGPRPEAPDHVDPAQDAWAASLALVPGIAGPTQVVIHGWEAHIDDVATYREEVLPHKLAVDAWYGTHASPAVDLAVVTSLVATVRHPDRETAVHRRLEAALPETMAAIRTGRDRAGRGAGR